MVRHDQVHKACVHAPAIAPKVCADASVGKPVDELFCDRKNRLRQGPWVARMKPPVGPGVKVDRPIGKPQGQPRARQRRQEAMTRLGPQNLRNLADTAAATAGKAQGQ